MLFDLLDHEIDFLELLDELIKEATDFEQKMLLVNKKQDFINTLIELEKYHLEHLLNSDKQLNNYILESRRNRNRNRDRDRDRD